MKINTYLPVFRGFYGSIFENEIDNVFENDDELINFPKGFPFYEYADYWKYYEAVSDKYCQIVQEEMSDFVTAIEYQSIDSPKEYNFRNDSINCAITPNLKAIKKYIFENKEQFEKYLVDHLRSRDGFISFHSCNFEEWRKETRNFTTLNDKQGFKLGFTLSFIAENEKINEDSQIDFSVMDRVYAGEYLKDEFYTMKEFFNDSAQTPQINMEALKDYLDSNGELPTNEGENLVKMAQEGYRKDIEQVKQEMEEYLGEELTPVYNLENIINATWQQIDNQSLTLKL